MREDSISGDFPLKYIDDDWHVLSSVIRRLLIDNASMCKDALVFDTSLKVNCFETEVDGEKRFNIEMYNESELENDNA